MMAKSRGALKEGYKQGPWRVARRPLAACYAAASEQDKGGFRVDCGNLFGRFGRLGGGCCVVLCALWVKTVLTVFGWWVGLQSYSNFLSHHSSFSLQPLAR